MLEMTANLLWPVYFDAGVLVLSSVAIVMMESFHKGKEFNCHPERSGNQD